MKFKTKILWFSLTLTILAAVAHFLSLNYYLYWRWFWFDIVVHLTAGAGVGCMAYWLGEEVSVLIKKELSPVKKRIIYLLLAILVSAGWEAFEYYFHLTDSRLRYVWSSGKDFLSSMVGILSVLYLLKDR
ncbi:MAG: hypothetical protein WCO30_01415 [bacterium]